MLIEKFKKSFMSNKKTSFIVVCVLILCIISAVFVPLLFSAKAYSFDDHIYLFDNNFVKNPSWSSAVKFFTNVLTPADVGSIYYQPVTLLSLMFDYSLAKGAYNIEVYHLTSLAIHILNTFLVMLFIYLIFKNILTASVASLLFGLHPVAVECTAWLSERKTLLATFFCLLALVFYVIYRTRINKKKLFYILSNIMFIIALLSKPTVITLPFILLLLDFFILKKFSFRLLFEKIPFLITMIVFGLITYFSHKTTATLVLPTSYLTQIPLTISYYCLYFLFKTVFPVGLSSFYDVPKSISFGNPTYLSAFIIFFILVIIILISLRYNKFLFTGFMFFLIAIFPALDLVRISKPLISFRFIYFPLIGVIFTISCFINIISKEQKNKLKLLLIPIFTAAIIFELSSSISYFKYWKNSEALYKNALKYAPEYNILWDSLGTELINKGQYDKSIEYFTKALKISPNDYLAYNNIASALINAGKYSEGFLTCMKSIHLNPKLHEPYYNIGVIFSQNNKLEDAQKMFNYTLQIKPSFEDAQIDLADILKRQGKVDEATKKYRQILNSNPNNSRAYMYMGLVYYDKKEVNESINYLKKAIAVDPKYIQAYHQLANILSNEDQLEAAIPYYKKAMELQPENVSVLLDYGKVHAQYGIFDEAINAFKKVMAIDNKNVDAHIFLGKIYVLLDKNNEAFKEFSEALKLNPLSKEAKEGLNSIK